MTTIAERIREMWERRQDLLHPKIPDDLPEWQRGLVLRSQMTWRIEQAAKIDAEINEAIGVMRELGVLPSLASDGFMGRDDH